MEILFFPSYQDRSRLIDEIVRSIWYFEPLSDQMERLFFMYRGQDLTTEDVDNLLSNIFDHVPDYFDPILAEWALRWKGKIEIFNDPEGRLENTWDHKTAGVLIWEILDSPRQAVFDELSIRVGAFYTSVDIMNHMGEAANRLLFVRKLVSPERVEAINQRSKNALEELHAHVAGRQVYAYGSAPSISQLVNADFDFGDGVHMVCNSMVRNTELMEALKPKIIVCGDPVFHAGPSRYAGEFRRELNEVVKRYDAYLVTLLDFIPSFQTCLEPDLHDRVIGLTLHDESEFSFNLCDNLEVKSTENILSMMMLPLAFSLTDDVRILGCDGRPFVQDGYFWKHDKKSQFDEYMEEIKKVHPGFFQRDFNAYYLSHCRVLEDILQQGERSGKTVNMITPSYIPPLAKRYCKVS